jgi:SAM-dependent methyltransferase
MTKASIPKLEFSEKYDAKHAKTYFDKHENGFWRRMSNLRDHQIARKALRLAGHPKSVLDMPCGTGRFWDVLAERPDRVIHASDYSQNMIDTGMAYRPPEITRRIHAFQSSAFDLPVEDNFVDCVFCIRFVHHLGKSEDRLKLFQELRRVSADSVIVSLWVDGNFKAMSRKALEEKRRKRGYQNRFVISRQTIEQEIEQSGFDIVAKLDFAKYFAMWRTYVLKKRA